MQLTQAVWAPSIPLGPYTMKLMHPSHSCCIQIKIRLSAMAWARLPAWNSALSCLSKVDTWTFLYLTEDKGCIGHSPKEILEVCVRSFCWASQRAFFSPLFISPLHLSCAEPLSPKRVPLWMLVEAPPAVTQTPDFAGSQQISSTNTEIYGPLPPNTFSLNSNLS